MEPLRVSKRFRRAQTLAEFILGSGLIVYSLIALLGLLVDTTWPVAIQLTWQLAFVLAAIMLLVGGALLRHAISQKRSCES
jgi:hypothetical protein